MNNQLNRSRINKPSLLILLVFLFVQFWANTASAKGKITFDRYYVVEFEGQHCGYARAAVRESDDQITSLSYIRFTIRQFGRDMLIVSKNISRETPAGELISMDQTLFTNGTTVTNKAVLQGRELVVTTTLLGRKTTKRFAVPPDGFVTQAGLERLIKSLLDSPGQRRRLTILSLEAASNPLLPCNPFLPCSVEIVGPETIQAYGQATSATKVKGTVTINGLEMPGTSWFDRQGELAAQMSTLGLAMRTYAADKAQAKKIAGPVDLTSISLVVPKSPLKNPAQAKKAVYRLKLKKADQPMFDLPQTDMQRIVAKGRDYVDLEVTRQDTQRFATVLSQQVPQNLQQYLQSSLYLDWHSPAVKAAAQQINCDSDKPWDIALGLYKYVDETIYIKNLEVYFDPASKVLAKHQGDCTEHAVLLAALARASGLPSRLVIGLTQVPAMVGTKAAFGYHAWTEVWIDGSWASLDAAQEQAPVDVGHIALGITDANSSEPLKDLSAALMLQVIGNLDIELLRQE